MQPSPSRRSRQATTRAAALATALAALVAAGGPAYAGTVDGTGGTGVAATASAPGTRQLTLSDIFGNQLTPSSTLNATNGSVPFSVKVTDSNLYANNGFEVFATMSNLYGYDNGTWNCSEMLPSSAVQLSTTPASTAIGGVTSALTPVIKLTGTISGSLLTSLTSALLSLASAGTMNTSLSGTVTGTLPSPGTLDQQALTGVSDASTILNGALAGLPVSVAPGATAPTPFASPDIAPSGSGCTDPGGTATQVVVMTGSSDTSGLTSAVSSLIGASPSAESLISAGYLSETAVVDWLASAGVLFPAGVSPSALVTDLGSTNLTDLLSALSATVSSVSSVAQDGWYSDVPAVSVSTAGASVPGTYRGAMTVTLMDTP